MSFTLLALLILWLVLPLAAAPSLRRIGLPMVISALTLAAAVMAGLIIVLVQEAGNAPAFAAVAGTGTAAPILRPMDLTLSLMAAGGLGLITAGLGERRKSRMAGSIATLGLGLCHAGAFAAILIAATPLREMTDIALAAQIATLALGIGAVIVLFGFLFALLRGLRLL